MNNKREVAYISAPFAADLRHSADEHIEMALAYALQATEQGGFIAFLPHVCFPFGVERTDRDRIMQFYMDILDQVDIVCVFGDRISSGMREEIEQAKIHKIPVWWDSAALEDEYEDMYR
jgi:hypothetical protein